MKLKSSFITHNIAGEQVMVSADTNVFSGIARSNATAAFIIECLHEDTSADAIAKLITDKYDVSYDVAKSDCEAIISQLDSIGAIEW